jgi:hypothetical protein
MREVFMREYPRDLSCNYGFALFGLDMPSAWP